MKATEWFKTITDFGNMCAYCQIREYEEKEHFIPRNKGGKDSVTNFLPACRECNKKKTDLTGKALIAVFGEATIERLRIYLEERFQQSIIFPEETEGYKEESQLAKRELVGKASKVRLNITIPNTLYERLEELRDRINLSKVCTNALEKEVAMLERRSNITDPRIAQLLKRLQSTRERWYQRGREDGIQWAVETATRYELQMVATKPEMQFDPHGSRPLFPTSFNPLERLQYWENQEAQEQPAGQKAHIEIDEAAYLEGWRDSVKEIWQAIAPAL